MNKLKYSMGLDFSTQSLTAVLMDMSNGSIAIELSINYIQDSRLDIFNLNRSSYLLPTDKNDAEQPPHLFLRAFEVIMGDLGKTGFPIDQIAIINVSAQQHAHVYLSETSYRCFEHLAESNYFNTPLDEIFSNAFSHPGAPIWKTNNTKKQADEIIELAGGKESICKISGSVSPLRFTGTVIRKVAQTNCTNYEQTVKIHLLSSLITAILTGNIDCAIDWGNGAGTGMMDYQKKNWSSILLKAVSASLPGGEAGLFKKLPPISSPAKVAGSLAPYHSNRYGLNAECLVCTGSGDNPQTKVLADGDLLSLGTSFVYMFESDRILNNDGSFNEMYDGLGHPFVFGCRTNGALVWDYAQKKSGIKNFEHADQVLEEIPAGSIASILQHDLETFPCSPAFSKLNNSETMSLEDYAGIIDSSLLAIRHFSGRAPSNRPLYVTGGPSRSIAIQKRIASIWNQPVIPLGRAGAALGAAAAGVIIYNRSELLETSRSDLSFQNQKTSNIIYPVEDTVKRYEKLKTEIIPYFMETCQN